MRSRFIMLLIACGFVAVFLLTAGFVHGQGTFANEDTATNRQDDLWGTRANAGQSYFGTDTNENDVWGYQPPAQEEAVDWYDKIVITVDPNVDWPAGGETATTTQSTTSVTAGGETNSTTTSTSTVAPNQ